DDKQPGEEQVPLPSHPQKFVARNGRPSRKGTARSIRIAENSRGIELVGQDRCDAAYLAVLDLHGADREPRLITIGTVAPIEGGMRIENLQSAHNQDEEKRDIKPMANPYGESMAVDPLHNRCDG